MDESKPGESSEDGIHPERSLRPNYYEALNIYPGAPRVQIRESYLRLKSTYSSGSAALYSLISEDEAKETMARIEEAFRVLNDDLTRREYDLAMGFGLSKGDRLGGAVGSRDPELVFQDQNLQSERLGHLRDQSGSTATAYDEWDQEALSEGDGLLRGSRGGLPLVQLKACRSSEVETQEKFGNLLSEGDPGDGDLYRRLREVAGVSEEEIQDRTKVCISYIRAIENNNYERLPQLVYVKGFLRSYLKYICIPNPEVLVSAFTERLSDWQANQQEKNQI